jgi:hypothetical protein
MTAAWGDSVLPSLPQSAKIYLQDGRFVEEAGGSVVFCVPRGILERARRVHTQAEAALSSHFGRPVSLALVAEPATAIAAGASPPPPAEEPDELEVYDLQGLTDAGPGLVSPEQRLLEAFPGAEEVTP